jgi:hypothetical protein
MHQAALILAMPGVAAFGYAVARGWGSARKTAAVLAPALGLAPWIVGVHTVARRAGSLRAGLYPVTLGLAGAGLAWTFARVAARRGEAWPHPRTWPWPMLLSALAVTLAVAPMAVGWAFHDEAILSGHLAITEQLTRDIYPPRHLAFPQFELRYHYGFNVVAAAIVEATGLSVPSAIDAATLAAWAYGWCLLWLIGEHITGSVCVGGGDMAWRPHRVRHPLRRRAALAGGARTVPADLPGVRPAGGQ